MPLRTLFIADLHLEAGSPAVEPFFAFLAEQTPGADALYILGDLFESWIGDDDCDPLTERVAHALRAVRERGTALYFMAGNRDFLLGADYAKQAGLELLPDPTRLELYGVPTLLLHGDSLCTRDVKYQAFRVQARNPQFQQQFLAQPLAQRKAYAAQVRAASREHTGNTALEIMDVTPELLSPLMQQYQVSRLIHGHTHRPAVHPLPEGERIVLSDWHREPTWLEVTPAGYRQILA